MKWLLLLGLVATCCAGGEPAPPAKISAFGKQTAGAQFSSEIRPALVRLCGDCHSKDKHVPFLKAESYEQINSVRWAWRSAISQLRNRTMPPAEDDQPTETERMAIADWLESGLRENAAALGDYAGAPLPRRLTRIEYDNTIRDLTGLALNYSETFPTEGGGGEGFSNNSETLFLPVILMERYLEAAQQILDEAIIAPPLKKTLAGSDFSAARVVGGAQSEAGISILETGNYEVEIHVKSEGDAASLALKVDGIAAHRFKTAADAKPAKATIRLPRGVHTLAVASDDNPAQLTQVLVRQDVPKLTDAKKAAHKRIFDAEAGAWDGKPADTRLADGRRIISNFAQRAFRRPLKEGELDRFMTLYARSAKRNEPFEESVKLALKGILVSPSFLFRVEEEHAQPGIYPLNDYELAARLSYFLLNSMPDEELLRLAGEKKLNDPAVLSAQVDRMLASPKLNSFLEQFVGEWLGTKEVGASVAFANEKFKGIYTSELAADLRAEPVQILQYLVKENRSLLELISADYVYVTERTAKHYGVEGVTGMKGNEFRRVDVKDGRRGGVTGLGAVHMLTSYPDRTSPVLRGAWVLETMLGVRVPAPPPDIPSLNASKKKAKDPSIRAILEQHRANPTCAACHNLIDPIGFGMENYDLLGRWRDDDGGKKIDASATMPSGEKFSGPKELKTVLLNRKDEFARHLCGKVLGYALGRSLEDRDDFTIEKITAALRNDGYKARTLLREVVLSIPFRNRQGGEPEEKKKPEAEPQQKKKARPAAKAP